MKALLSSMRWFTEESRALSCLTVTFGTAQTERHALTGLMRVKELGGADVPVDDASIFDLASLTKLFTGLTILRLREEGKLDLQKPVAFYEPRFSALGDVTVEQVLAFELTLLTPARVDAQKDREAGLAQLFAVKAVPHGSGRIYSDMHAMVLKYVIEAAAQRPYFEVLSALFLRPLGMAHTYACVPEGQLSHAVSCDREHRIEGARWIVREGIAAGTVHDPKARLLSEGGRDLCGHAGLFATRADMTRFCQAVLRGDVLSREGLRFMARNRTGHPLAEGGYSQYLGCQCYVKHPQQFYSEIPAYMGSQAIGLSGFTGNHISIDPQTGVFALFLGGRVLNRLSVLVPESGKSLTDYGLAADGTGCVTWTDGEQVASSVNYVHQKDARLHRHIARLLGLPTQAFADSEQP